MARKLEVARARKQTFELPKCKVIRIRDSGSEVIITHASGERQVIIDCIVVDTGFPKLDLRDQNCDDASGDDDDRSLDTADVAVIHEARGKHDCGTPIALSEGQWDVVRGEENGTPTDPVFKVTDYIPNFEIQPLHRDMSGTLDPPKIAHDGSHTVPQLWEPSHDSRKSPAHENNEIHSQASNADETTSNPEELPMPDIHIESIDSVSLISQFRSPSATLEETTAFENHTTLYEKRNMSRQEDETSHLALSTPKGPLTKRAILSTFPQLAQCATVQDRANPWSGINHDRPLFTTATLRKQTSTQEVYNRAPDTTMTAGFQRSLVSNVLKLQACDVGSSKSLPAPPRLCNWETNFLTGTNDIRLDSTIESRHERLTTSLISTARSHFSQPTLTHNRLPPISSFDAIGVHRSMWPKVREDTTCPINQKAQESTTSETSHPTTSEGCLPFSTDLPSIKHPKQQSHLISPETGVVGYVFQNHQAGKPCNARIRLESESLPSIADTVGVCRLLATPSLQRQQPPGIVNKPTSASFAANTKIANNITIHSSRDTQTMHRAIRQYRPRSSPTLRPDASHQGRFKSTMRCRLLKSKLMGSTPHYSPTATKPSFHRTLCPNNNSANQFHSPVAERLLQNLARPYHPESPFRHALAHQSQSHAISPSSDNETKTMWKTANSKQSLIEWATILFSGQKDIILDDDETTGLSNRSYPDVCGVVVDLGSAEGIVVVTSRGTTVHQADTGHTSQTYTRLDISLGQMCMTYGNPTVLYYRSR